MRTLTASASPLRRTTQPAQRGSHDPSVCHDGGRLEIDGFDETIWVSHQYSIDIEEI